MRNYKLNESKMFADIADNLAIVINSETGIYYGMNSFGSVIFDALIKGVSVENIKQSLKAMPEAPADIETKFDTFLTALIEDEVVVEAPENNMLVPIDLQIAKTDAFVMDFQSYTDAQEMLLADPIHEVKEETGWTPEKESIGYTKEETLEREKKIEE